MSTIEKGRLAVARADSTHSGKERERICGDSTRGTAAPSGSRDETSSHQLHQRGPRSSDIIPDVSDVVHTHSPAPPNSSSSPSSPRPPPLPLLALVPSSSATPSLLPTPPPKSPLRVYNHHRRKPNKLATATMTETRAAERAPSLAKSSSVATTSTSASTPRTRIVSNPLRVAPTLGWRRGSSIPRGHQREPADGDDQEAHTLPALRKGTSSTLDSITTTTAAESTSTLQSDKPRGRGRSRSIIRTVSNAARSLSRTADRWRQATVSRFRSRDGRSRSRSLSLRRVGRNISVVRKKRPAIPSEDSWLPPPDKETIQLQADTKLAAILQPGRYSAMVPSVYSTVSSTRRMSAVIPAAAFAKQVTSRRQSSYSVTSSHSQTARRALPPTGELGELGELAEPVNGSAARKYADRQEVRSRHQLSQRSSQAEEYARSPPRRRSDSRRRRSRAGSRSNARTSVADSSHGRRGRPETITSSKTTRRSWSVKAQLSGSDEDGDDEYSTAEEDLDEWGSHDRRATKASLPIVPRGKIIDTTDIPTGGSPTQGTFPSSENHRVSNTPPPPRNSYLPPPALAPPPHHSSERPPRSQRRSSRA